jgi:hypothetical protein
MLAENLVTAELLAAENAENHLAHEQARRPSIWKKMQCVMLRAPALFRVFRGRKILIGLRRRGN